MPEPTAQEVLDARRAVELLRFHVQWGPDPVLVPGRLQEQVHRDVARIVDYSGASLRAVVATLSEVEYGDGTEIWLVKAWIGDIEVSLRYYGPDFALISTSLTSTSVRQI